MPSRDPYLTRVNRALKDLGCAVAIEVAPSGKRLRLRSTLPLPDGSWKQQRISTPIFYPAGLEQARKLAEEIGRDTPDAMAARALEYRSRGYRRLQVKVGGDPVSDASGLRAVAEAVPDAELYCDANGGWSMADARRFLADTESVGYVLEQPCATMRESVLLRPHAGRPMVLDESIASLVDVVDAAGAGIDGITIKIARVGGVTAARTMRDTAVALGMMVTVEDTGGADIDTAAMAHLSISTPAARRAHTVDFHHWVTVSNGTGIPPTDGGLLRPPTGAGLGVEVDVTALGEAVCEAGE